MWSSPRQKGPAGCVSSSPPATEMVRLVILAVCRGTCSSTRRPRQVRRNLSSGMATSCHCPFLHRCGSLDWLAWPVCLQRDKVLYGAPMLRQQAVHLACSGLWLRWSARPAEQAASSKEITCNQRPPQASAPGEDEGLPDVVVSAAHDPVLGAHAGDVPAPVALHAQDQIVKVLQVDQRVRGCRLLQGALCQSLSAEGLDRLRRRRAWAVMLHTPPRLAAEPCLTSRE